ncbi:MAG: insulinase family protein [Parvularculaceae bacterium]
MLEDHTLPVSQPCRWTYKVGGRDDPEGRMGIARLLRARWRFAARRISETGLIGNIYAMGGEWHGYAWIDQTTYFSTAPKENLDLLLRIRSDRMNNLDMDPNDVKAEFGAVLTEMNSYEGDPFASLYDAVTATISGTLTANTIGYDRYCGRYA